MSIMPYLKYVIAVLILSISASIAQNYLWPTDASKLITSSFGEFRPRHFHAAVDIKTWGQSGYKIFAIENGYVYRIRVSSHGYGKAIYLKLYDGNIVVYAHLDGFIPELEAYTDSLRLSAQNNTLDTFLKPFQFPVKKGQLLGYTGDTGIGVPHLHFEIRDSGNRPVNPLRYYGQEIKDRIPPLTQAIALVPLSAMTLINFQPDTLILNVQPRPKIEITQPTYLTGKAYIALKAFDQADGATNRFSFYKASLLVNDSLVYQVSYDRFNYAETRLVELDKNFSLWRKGLGVFHNFYKHSYNSLSFYGNSKYESGTLSSNSLREGLNHIRIQLADFDGNHSEIALRVVYHKSEQFKVFDLSKLSDKVLMGLKSPIPIGSINASYLTVDLSRQRPLEDIQMRLLNQFMDNYYYSLLLPFQTEPEYSILQIDSYDEREAPLLPAYIDLDDRRNTSANFGLIGSRFSGNWLGLKTNGSPEFPGEVGIQPAFAFQPDPHTSYWVIHMDSLAKHLQRDDSASTEVGSELSDFLRWTQIAPGRSASVHSSDQHVKIDFPADAAYDTFFCRIIMDDSPPAFPPGYPNLSPLYSVQPFDQVMNRGAFLNITIADSVQFEKGLGIYYRDRRKGWLFLPTDRRGNTFRSRITSLEKFVVIKDTIPPTITPIDRLYAGKIHIQNDRLRFSVIDEMAGIYKQEQITVHIDDKWTLFRYDPEENMVMIYPQHIPNGEHRLTLTVTDNVGNQTRQAYTISKQ